jgi:hypothetical protein
LGSVIDKDLRKQLIKELYDTSVNQRKVDEVFRQVMKRVKSNIYQAVNCTQDACNARQMVFRHPLAHDRMLGHTQSILEVDLQEQFKNYDLSM